MEKWGQIFIIDIIGLEKTAFRLPAKQAEGKVKDKDLTPNLLPNLLQT